MTKSALCIFLLATVLLAQTPAHTGIRFREVKPQIDQIFVPNRGEELKMGSYRWLLPQYPQADTCLLVRRDGDYIDSFSYTFYWGFDAKREEHYKQSLPILASLFRIFMPSLKLTTDQIDRHLQTAKSDRKPVTFTADRLSVQIRFITSSREDIDIYGYRCFCLEFAPVASTAKSE